jgi:phosphate:Na+ symporter
MDFTTLLKICGGLGLFLLGLVIMTDGLRALAGDAMRRVLMRFTRSPLTGAVTGATATLILQSSSATTVAAVGFVGAGLMSFSQALGVIFGANIGTTLRGWVIVLVGFKLQLGLVLMPLVLAGALARLLSRARLAQIGFALAGFGLMFIGIDVLQQAMKGLEGVVTPADFPEDTLAGRVQLILSGALITVVMQSSGAGVAAALAALYAGTINFHQAAALVIGMDIGTTFTAAMATLGGTVGARRTGFSHVIYNLFTGLGALLLLTPYMQLMEWLSPGALQQDAEFALVAFHSGFNILGVMVALPFTRQFAQLIERLFPERAPIYTHGLDASLLKEPGVALTAIHSAILDETQALLAHARALLGGTATDDKINLIELQAALNKTHDYIDQIHLKNGESPHWNTLLAQIHAIDHMQRLHERCEEDAGRAETARTTAELSGAVHSIKTALDEISYELAGKNLHQAHSLAAQNLRFMDTHAEPLRADIMRDVASGKLNVREGTECLEAIRWLQRVSVHIERITDHLQAMA